MKKTYIVILILAGCLTTSAGESRPLDIRAMTFNIRNGRANDGKNHWNQRKEFVCDVIRDYSPDVLGVQEAHRFQLNEFNKRLPRYSEVGIGRHGGARGEHSSILYLKSRFKVDKSGTFWLSNTPTQPSAHWGNRYQRTCTWARFVEKESVRAFYVYNTHMDHQSQRAREKGAQLIMKTIKERTHPDPFILMGDFNASESNPVIGYLKGTEELASYTPIPVVDSWRVVHPDEKVVGTFSRFNGYVDGSKIDYIFMPPDSHVVAANILRTSRDGRNPSDHYPVTAHLKLIQAPSVTAVPTPRGDQLSPHPLGGPQTSGALLADDKKASKSPFDWEKAKEKLRYSYKKKSTGRGAYKYHDRKCTKLLDGKYRNKWGGQSVGWKDKVPSPVVFRFSIPVKPTALRIFIHGGGRGGVSAPSKIEVYSGTITSQGKLIGEKKDIPDKTGWVDIPLSKGEGLQYFRLEVNSSRTTWVLIDEVVFK